MLVGFACVPGRARAAAYLPPPHQIFSGATGPVAAFEAATGKHPAIVQEFLAWGQYLPAIPGDALAARARLMIHITTAFGSREAITPAAIASGAGDAWLIGLARQLAASGNVTYVRLMAEMDGSWNPYCAYSADGSSRGAAHSTFAYRQAWRRVTLILRGGPIKHIDQILGRLRLPPLRTQSDLPRPKVAMLWVPQVAGSPDLPGNSPRAYFPGRAWVDWVGTDFYAKFPNFSGLTRLYDAFGGLPFVFGEYALWGTDDPAWIHALFGWVRSHSRVRMLLYNEGMRDGGPFRLSHYPAAARALRGELAGGRFPAFAPEWRPVRAPSVRRSGRR